MYLEVDAEGADAALTLSGIPGATRVVESTRHGTVVGYEVESEQGRDIRRQLARAVVTSGWGLLEFRPLRMSLEDIFLSLTTDESPEAADAAAAGAAAAEEGASDA
jgi:gliding motility-associated transport system ATP-binding protein